MSEFEGPFIPGVTGEGGSGVLRPLMHSSEDGKPPGKPEPTPEPAPEPKPSDGGL